MASSRHPTRKAELIMRILSLELTNFLPILSGTGKESIFIDLSNSDELITVLIGKIGSGKTYILSHLQPFSTVGTLDIRNQDDPIIEGKSGKKEITYSHNSHFYKITHDFHWTGKTHSKKSYIEKDGVELNENGNRSSFEEIVEIELGITPGMLRLLRLGPNVVNFIPMKSTERKAYIATLSQDTDMYLALYKYWSKDLRDTKSQASLLMSKLNQFGTKTMEEREEELDETEGLLTELQHEIDTLTKQKYEWDAENKAWLKGLTYAEMKQLEHRLEEEIPQKREEIAELEQRLQKFDQYPDITEVSKEIGRMDQELAMISEEKVHLEKECESLSSQINHLTEKKKIHADDTQMDSLRKTYGELQELDRKYTLELRGFRCDYSSTFLSGLLEELNVINVLISEITQYDTQMITRLLHSDASIIEYARKKVDMLGYKKLKIQGEINNLRFSEEYTPVTPLYRPPFCPTDTCPYFVTHPVQIKKGTTSKQDAEGVISAYQEDIRKLDIEIYQYSEYPLLYGKISSLKTYWKKASEILRNINALNTPRLENVLTLAQCRVWYNYDRVVHVIDQLEKREKHFELAERIKQIRHELDELESSDQRSIEEEICDLQNQKTEKSDLLFQKETRYQELHARLTDFNQLYLDLSNKTIHEKAMEDGKSQLASMTHELEDASRMDEQIQQNVIRIQKKDQEIIEKQKAWNDLSGLRDQLLTKIHDIKETSADLDRLLQEQKYLQYMVNASSPKEGIPLKMIEIFLNSCRDVVNDLIYDVCEDELEILPFDITSTDFRIPYVVNGQRIDDISKASQGQSSIVSTALSFALVQKTQHMFYNIPLFDEMDAPLHRNDKQKFISILLKHLKKIGSEQCFVITHDENTFDGYPVQVIMTTDEHVNRERYSHIIQV